MTQIQSRREVSVTFRVPHQNNISTCFFQLNFIMPRRPLAQISGNTTKRSELSPYLRGLIIGKHDSGITPSQISRDLKIPRTTINGTIQRILHQNDGKSSP